MSRPPLFTGTIATRKLTDEEKARRDAGLHPLDDSDVPHRRMTVWHIALLVVGALALTLIGLVTNVHPH